MIFDVGLVYHQDFSKYDFGEGQFFRGDRYLKAMDFFKRVGMLNQIRIFIPSYIDECGVLKVHSKGYLDQVKQLNITGGALSADTYVSPGMYDIARLFAGANVLAADLVITNKCQRCAVFGLGGHHAGADYGGGFCIINDIAIMIEIVKQKYNANRILVFDYDAHCGNGCQDIFHEDPSVLYIDFHQDPRTLYPGVGYVEDIGLGAGLGFTVNVPLPPGTTDKSFLKAVHEILVPLSMEYNPEIILAVGGIDAHFQDPLSRLNFSLKGYRLALDIISEISLIKTKGKFILIGSSGYNADIIPLGWHCLLSGVLQVKGKEMDKNEIIPEEPYSVTKSIEQIIGTIKNMLSPYWSCFKDKDKNRQQVFTPSG
ncbi:MAG: hypothetical protein JRJ57_00505 [Deltaproteobacteria bacterium]|nr:hypothetical protein [Deltaproteobacteria bacterium]